MEPLSFPDDPRQLRWFGKEPFAAMCTAWFRIEAPIGQPCGWCVEPVGPDDDGLTMLDGNLGSGVIKTSAVKDEHRVVTAPAIVFDDQADFLRAFSDGELDRDFV